MKRKKNKIEQSGNNFQKLAETVKQLDEERKALTRSAGSLRLQCHRCGWEGVEPELDINEHGKACPKCPQFRDIHASLSIIENAEDSRA